MNLGGISDDLLGIAVPRFADGAAVFVLGLQSGLRPARPARQAGVELAARCLPATGHIIGGDWYDVIPLPGDRTGLLIGDAMGHGPAAAALTDITYATCAYCVIDPSTGTGTIALAGHLPPVIALPDGTTRVPALRSGLSLGLGTAIFGQARIGLPPGRSWPCSPTGWWRAGAGPSTTASSSCGRS